MKFYEFCAAKIVAANRLLADAVVVSMDREQYAMARDKSDLHIEQLEKAVKEFCPSGSGYDNGTQLDIDASSDKKLVFRTAFHHMNDNGYYDGWTSHTVIVKPTFDGVSISVGGRNRNDIKEYIADTFHHIGSIDVDWQGKFVGEAK